MPMLRVVRGGYEVTYKVLQLSVISYLFFLRTMDSQVMEGSTGNFKNVPKRVPGWAE